MWIECEARVGHRQRSLTGVAVAAAVRDHLPALRRAADPAARKEAKRHYREHSQHCEAYGERYIESVLAVEDTPARKVYWLEGPVSHDDATLIRVSEMQSAAMRADVFALRAFHEVERSLPLAYHIRGPNSRARYVAAGRLRS